jgi:hypothetical protein
MIATKTMAVLKAATILAAGVSIALFLGAEATVVNTTRSNIKTAAIGQEFIRLAEQRYVKGASLID